MTRLRYFAYGSNLHLARIRRRVSSALVKATGQLPGFRLSFNKNSRDGSAKCNAIYTGRSGDYLPGVVYEINASQKCLLDAAEGLGSGYFQASHFIDVETGPVEAYLYVAHPAHTNEDIQPYDWYCELVIRGAKQQGLNAGHVNELIGTPSLPDPNRERSRRMFDLARIEAIL